MRTILNAFMTLCFILSAVSFASAQNESKTIQFRVTGNCSMCKKTIESSLIGKPGISSASWNKDTKMMKVVFDPAKISEDQIHHKIADSGYDTEKVKASDKAYNSLPGCCQYNRTLHQK